MAREGMHMAGEGMRMHVDMGMGCMLERAPVGVGRVVEHVRVEPARAIAVDERRRRHQPRARGEGARARQQQGAVEEKGQAERRAQRRRLAVEARDERLSRVVPE